MKLFINNIKPSDLSSEYTYIQPSFINTIENNSCEEIELGYTLDTLVKRNELLIACIHKLRKNGVINLMGVEIMEVCRRTWSGRLTVNEANNIIYAERQSIDNIFRVISILQDNGCVIIDKQIIDFSYQLKAIKL